MKSIGTPFLCVAVLSSFLFCTGPQEAKAQGTVRSEEAYGIEIDTY